MTEQFIRQPLAPPAGGPEAGAPEPGSLKLFIKSFGCQMNAYDAARMSDSLVPEGYVETASIEDADLVILNTCHIRERAAEKVYSELGKIRELKAADPGRRMTLAVAGCVAQAEGDEIIRRQKAVDLVVGPQSYHRLPDLVRRARQGISVVDTDFPVESKFDHLAAPSPARIRARGLSAFVTVQEGCDKFCSFCVVPYTRGAETSRPPEAIVAEVETMVASGVREVTLLGQNVNAYHGADRTTGRTWTLARLATRLADIRGLARIRYTTSHPNDMDDDLIEAHAFLPALMPFLHLPVQSGSDRILAAMNRRHTARHYLDLVDRIRSARPDIALSSDFIVGFPGETEADFEDTLRLVEAVGYASAFSFKYSPRPGTPSAALDQVEEPTKRERLARLQGRLDAQRQAFNAATLGCRVDVLFEKPGRQPGQIGGRTPHLHAVHVEADPSLIGRVAPVDILSVGVNSLHGRLATATTPAASMVYA